MSGPCDWDWVEFLTVEDIAWLTELPYTISIPSLDALVVHAGLVPRVPLQQQSQEDIVNIRNVIQTAPGMPCMGDIGGMGGKGGEVWGLWDVWAQTVCYKTGYSEHTLFLYLSHTLSCTHALMH